MNIYLKAKIKEIYITGRKLECDGSLTLDEDLMDKLGVNRYEQVFVNSKHGKGRIMTYLLPGQRGTKICELNGGAGNHFNVDEIVHLLIFAISDTPINPIIL